MHHQNEGKYLHFPANYFTAKIYEWKPLLANDTYKNIIIGSSKIIEISP